MVPLIVGGGVGSEDIVGRGGPEGCEAAGLYRSGFVVCRVGRGGYQS